MDNPLRISIITKKKLKKWQYLTHKGNPWGPAVFIICETSGTVGRPERATSIHAATNTAITTAAIPMRIEGRIQI